MICHWYNMLTLTVIQRIFRGKKSKIEPLQIFQASPYQITFEGLREKNSYLETVRISRPLEIAGYFALYMYNSHYINIHSFFFFVLSYLLFAVYLLQVSHSVIFAFSVLDQYKKRPSLNQVAGGVCTNHCVLNFSTLLQLTL